jgi:diguanylate cyclase (GGDEF)-like protein
MSELVDHLAELTGFRDRDVLDVTLAGVMRDILQPRLVAIYRCVSSSTGAQYWLTRSRLSADDVAATADPAWIELDRLPPLESAPHRRECLRRQAAMSVPGSPALMLFPLENDCGAVGVLEIVTEKPLDSSEQRLVHSVLRIYRNFQGLLDYSERDTLTGLLNRKTFDSSFLKATAESRTPEPTGASEDRRRAMPAHATHWLGVIDIDHFKRVNDTYGHLIGDEVLLLLSRLMRSTFRHHDQLYRFGGEEFVVLMRGGSDGDAAVAFARLRHNVERYLFPQVGHVTISVGFTEVRVADAPSAAFERADKAVYHAKTNGRNQVVSHAALVASGTLHEASKVGDVELF